MTVKDLPILDNTDKHGLHRNADTEHAIEDYNKAKKKRNAAVLIPLVRSMDEWHILFIRRASNKEDRHSGQVAFPGGAADSSDKNPTDTALRETSEEIGVSSDRIKIVSQLDAYYTISNYRVTPVVGILKWPSNLKLETAEVARAFLIPLNWLEDENNFTLRARNEMDNQSAKRHPIIVYNEFDGETLWGATARMTMNFIKALNEKAILLPS